MPSAAELSRASQSGGLFGWLARRSELAHARRMYRLEHPTDARWNWPDARGWIGTGVFCLSVMLLWMMRDADLRNDEFFQTIVTVIISNGLMAVVAWAYAATKSGGEIAERNAGIAERTAAAAVVPGNGTGSGA